MGTNTSGIWNMNSSGNYEIECFVFGTFTGTRHLLRLFNSENTEVLTVSITTDRQITVLCSDWGITSAVTSSTAFTASTWQHVLLRVKDNTLKVYIEGTESISEALTSNVTLSVNSVKLGYSSTSAALFIDEFVFRHSAGSDAPEVPTHPYSGQLILDTVGGYGGVGSLSDGAATVSGTPNKYGLIKTVTDAKTFTVNSWSSGTATPEAGREVMIHITAPKSTASAAYPLVGLYAFAKIESVDGNSVVLTREITTENGYDFTLDSSILSTYYVQAITVPCYDELTNSGSVALATWSTTAGGGIVALRTKGDCSITGSILTHGKEAVRYDLHQMTNSKLIDRFLCSQGGGVFISCGGTLTLGSSARLGASWSGTLGAGTGGKKAEGGNGGACYGGGGGGDTDGSGTGGKGGVGGAGGGGDNQVGGQAGTSDTGGYGKQGTTQTVRGGTQGVTAGGNAPDTVYASGGGGAGGNGGNVLSSNIIYLAGGKAGASVILIAKTLKAQAIAISTGGEGGNYNILATGGGGTGFCYIACESQVSA